MQKAALPILDSIFLIVGIAFSQCSLFASEPSLPDGIVMGKVFWLQNKLPFVVALVWVGCLIAALDKKRKLEWTVDWKAGLALTLPAAFLLLTYNWKLNPAPQVLRFVGTVAILWLLLRLALSVTSRLKEGLFILLLCSGLLEALLGLAQAYGFQPSLNALFSLTGTFYNPGPFAGYLAVLLPIAVGFLLRGEKTPLPLRCLCWACLLSTLLVLPASLSRTAWLATLVGCAVAAGPGFLKLWKGLTRRLPILSHPWGKVMLFFAAFLLCSGLYFMKKGSADGRLLMWKATASAMIRHPLGIGLGGFPAVYAETQAAYFASGKASSEEKWVAGCPPYAFNEYLQTGLEQGLAGLAAFLLCLGFFLWRSRKDRRLLGAWTAFCIFMAASYPLRLPAFWLLFAFLTALTPAAKTGCKMPCPRLLLPACGLALFVVASFIAYTGRNDKGNYEAWGNAAHLYRMGAFKQAATAYAPLYSQLKYSPAYLFEYAQSLSNSGHPAEAIPLLRRAIRLSSDPMMRYMLAKDKQALGDYKGAESDLLQAINILPERIYPWYLLMNLYAEPKIYDKAKLQAAADSVLHKRAKANSEAIRQMRKEAKRYIKEEKP
jgi:O-antigen ligase